MTDVLNEAQAAIVDLMKQYPTIIWWSLDELEFSRANIDSLAESDVLILGAGSQYSWWRLAQRPLSPTQKQIVRTLRRRLAESSPSADLPGDQVDLDTLIGDGIVEIKYCLTEKGIHMPDEMIQEAQS